jgi:hypothetical protein
LSEEKHLGREAPRVIYVQSQGNRSIIEVVTVGSTIKIAKRDFRETGTQLLSEEKHLVREIPRVMYVQSQGNRTIIEVVTVGSTIKISKRDLTETGSQPLSEEKLLGIYFERKHFQYKWGRLYRTPCLRTRLVRHVYQVLDGTRWICTVYEI